MPGAWVVHARKTGRAGQGAGGERGIRTLETVPRLHTFQACAFDHSATSPAGGQNHFSAAFASLGPEVPADVPHAERPCHGGVTGASLAPHWRGQPVGRPRSASSRATSPA